MAGSYEYTIALVDKISAPARAASSALGGLKSALQAAESVSVKPPAAVAAARAATAGGGAPTVNVDKATGALGKLSSAMGSAADGIKTGEAIIGGAVNGMRAAITSLASGDVTGAIAGVTDTVSSLAKALDLAVPGLGQVVSAVVSIVGGMVGITAGLTLSIAKFAIASTEAKTAAIAQWDALGQGVVKGAEVDEMLDKLRTSTGLTKDALAPLTTEFLRMGVTGTSALESLTVAAASAEAVVKGGGAAFAKFFQQIDAAAQTGSKLTLPYKKLQAQLVATGLNVADLAKQMGKSEAELTAGLKAGTVDARAFGDAMTAAITKKGAGPMATLANSAANLGNLLKEYLGDLFEDLGDDIAPFMAAVREAFGVLSSASPLGQQLKATIGSAMSSLFATLTKLVPVAREAFWTVVVWALKAYIAIAPIVFRIRDMIMSATGLKILSTIGSVILTAFKAVGVVILVVVGVIGALMAVSVAAGVAVWALISYFVKAGIAVGAFVAEVLGFAGSIAGAFIASFVNLQTQSYAALVGIYESIKGVLDMVIGAFMSAGASVSEALSTVWNAIASVFSVDQATSIATGLIEGLIGGITGGAARVADSLKAVGQGAIDGVKGILGIASPSKVMAELGGHTAEGFAQGVDAGSGASQGALESAVAPPTAATGGGGGGGGGGVTINVGGLTITIGAGASPETAEKVAELLPSAIARAFEDIALQLGGALGGGEPA
jgi:phage-related protein